jgi:hypothetical protein
MARLLPVTIVTGAIEEVGGMFAALVDRGVMLAQVAGTAQRQERIQVARAPASIGTADREAGESSSRTTQEGPGLLPGPFT